MTFISRKTGQFTYFSLQLGGAEWGGKEVLDFGGNVGNILRDPNSTIDEEHYWCIDVGKESVEKGRAAYPKAHWIFYDRYCFFFNPRGVPGLPLPDLGRKFDYVVAYSVFTNTTQSDMLDLVGQLEAVLERGGVLAFTFIDPHHHSWPGKYAGDNFLWRLELENHRGNVSAAELPRLAERARRADWLTLVNGNDLYVETEETRPYAPERQKTFHVFHTEKHMRGLFPHATILPPVNGEMQHCCVIRQP